MKNIFKSIFTVAAATVLAVSCDVEALKTTFDPNTVKGTGVTFLQSVVNDQEIKATQQTYEIDLSRAIATAAQTVNLTSTFGDGIVCPASVAFAAGEYQTKLVLDISGMSVGKSFAGTISVDEGLEEGVKPFGPVSLSCTLAKAYTWNSIGKGQFLDLFWEGELFDDVEVLKAEGFELYRFMNPYKDTEYGEGPKPDYIQISVNPDNTFVFQTFATPYLYDTEHAVTAYFPSSASSSAASYDPYNVFVSSYYFAFVPYWYVPSVGGWGCNYGYTLFAALPGAPQDIYEWYQENFE